MTLNVGFTFDDLKNKVGSVVEEGGNTLMGATAQFKEKPSKAVIALLRGVARTTAAAPGDLLDLIAEHATPPGTRSPRAGDTLRRWLDKTPLAADESPSEKIGEFTGAPRNTLAKTLKESGTQLGIMAAAKDAIKSGLLHPDALADAKRMLAQGRHPDDIWSQTRVALDKPGELPGAKTYPMTAIETPGYTQGGPPPGPGGQTLESLGARIQSGDVAGFDNVLKMYPNLAGTPIGKTMHGGPGSLGSFDPNTGAIEINYGHGGPPSRNFDTALGHEVSHNMAKEAGTPSGSNPQRAGKQQRVGEKVFLRAGKDAEAAFIARSLAEDRGLFDRGFQVIPGIPNANPREVVELYRKSAGKAPPLTMHALALALLKTPEELLEHGAMIDRLIGKIAPSNVNAYLTKYGERNAAVSQWQMGKTLQEIQRRPPNTIVHTPMSRLWEDRDFDPAEWRKHEVR